MQCTIYSQEELKRLRRAARNRVIVLARFGGGLILQRDELNALWMLPSCERQKGEDAPEAARRALGEAIGEAVFEVEPLCAFSVTEEDGKESGGLAFAADVSDWPEQDASASRAFAQMPLGSQVSQAALVFGLHRWAGDFFDERLNLERLGDVSVL